MEDADRGARTFCTRNFLHEEVAVLGLGGREYVPTRRNECLKVSRKGADTGARARQAEGRVWP